MKEKESKKLLLVFQPLEEKESKKKKIFKS